jgi:hypothetical protein
MNSWYILHRILFQSLGNIIKKLLGVKEISGIKSIFYTKLFSPWIFYSFRFVAVSDESNTLKLKIQNNENYGTARLNFLIYDTKAVLLKLHSEPLMWTHYYLHLYLLLTVSTFRAFWTNEQIAAVWHYLARHFCDRAEAIWNINFDWGYLWTTPSMINIICLLHKRASHCWRTIENKIVNNEDMIDSWHFVFLFHQYLFHSSKHEIV